VEVIHHDLALQLDGMVVALHISAQFFLCPVFVSPDFSAWPTVAPTCMKPLIVFLTGRPEYDGR
jgi:hypothetical protein